MPAGDAILQWADLCLLLWLMIYKPHGSHAAVPHYIQLLAKSSGDRLD